MALTRAMLKGMGLNDEQISAIIDAHTETTNGLKEERDKYRADAEKLPSVQKELDEMKKDGGDWQKKFEKCKELPIVETRTVYNPFSTGNMHDN